MSENRVLKASNGKCYGAGAGDNDWNTPKPVWDKIAPLLDKKKQYWLPFYNDGYSGLCMRDNGFRTIEKDEDFWKNMYDDVIVVDNPPYKVKGIPLLKKKIMERLCDNNIPFCLLFPSTVIQTKYFKELQEKYGKFQLIIPSEKIDFEKYEGHESKCLFYTLWVCWNMELPRDCVWV